MITGILIKFFWGIAHALLLFVPTFTVPAWFTSVSSGIATFFGSAGYMGLWYPVDLVRTVVSAVFWVGFVSFVVGGAHL